jgi:hypothetical protein
MTAEAARNLILDKPARQRTLKIASE